MSKEELIHAIRHDLQKNPFDIIHDEDHHASVWNNCRWIIRSENLTGLDEEALELAAWLHDLNKGRVEEDTLLKEQMFGYGLDITMQDRVLEIAGSHTFGKSQSSPESQVLFDADKLEYVSVERGKALLSGFKNGQIDRQKLDDYIARWRERILIVRDQIHFPSSREKFEERLKLFVDTVNSDEGINAITGAIVI